MKTMLLFYLQCAQSDLDIDTVRTVLSEYRIANADITVREDATVDDLIDVVEGNRYRVQTSRYKSVYKLSTSGACFCSWL